MRWWLSVCAAQLAWLVCASGRPSHRDGYNEGQAIRYAQYARSSFCTPRSLEAWSCGDPCDAVPKPAGVRVIGPGPSWDLQGVVVLLSDSDGADGAATAAVPPPPRPCVVAFRGSVEAANWLADADFVKTRWPLEAPAPWCPQCEVHRGFALSYAEVRDELLAGVAELGCKHFSFTGHSLGGAVATLAALDFRANLLLPVDPVITFGSPRVGDENFASAFRQAAAQQKLEVPSWRLVHWHDPVPRLAPRLCVNNRSYTHVSREVYYTKHSDSFRLCDSSGEDEAEHWDKTCSDSVSLAQCINMEHVTYLNLTFKHDELPEQCQEPQGGTQQRRETPVFLKPTEAQWPHWV